MNQVYMILIALHSLMAVVYSADYYVSRKEIQGTALRFVIIFLIPFFGFIFMWYSDIYTNRMSKIKGRDFSLQLDKNAELELLRTLDVSDEVNKVPMVEALSMGDTSYRRKMIVDTLREDDTLEYLTVLKEALLNEDSETSHYASAVIMEVQGRLQDSLLKKEIRFHENPQDTEAAYDYEENLYQLITSGIYDSRNLNKYYVKYKIVSDTLLGGKDVRECCYHNRICVDFATGDVGHAQKLCEQYKEAFPESEEMVVDNIKLCIQMQDRERLDAFFRELKELPVLLTSYSLQYVRFFERRNA